MTVMADVTPAIRFFNEIKSRLYLWGYDIEISSLYQVRPTEGSWYLHATLTPHVRTGKRATLALRLDEVSDDGLTVHVGLEKLTLKPTDSSVAHDKLRHDIESHSDSHGGELDSAHLALLVTDALDFAGISG